MNKRAWSTGDELAYIDALPRFVPQSREQALRSYIRAAESRDDWGRVNATTVWRYANASLRREMT